MKSIINFLRICDSLVLSWS